MHHLLKFGGFPEPLLKGQERQLRRWQRERLERVIYGDLRDLERVRELSLIELLVDSLPERIGSPLTLNKLAEQLQVSHQSIRRWLEILDRVYLSFRIAPFGTAKIRAVKKEQKLYLWDWSMVSEQGARWENLVACQLLKYCHFQEDYHGYRMELRYLRDIDGREVDFVVLQDRKAIFAVECKSGERGRSKAGLYFRQRTSIPRFYQVHSGTRDTGDASVETRVLPFTSFCHELAMP